MEKQLQNFNQPTLMSGVALASTAALSVYSIKNIIEMNKKIDDIHEDMEKIKQFIMENQRKNNITAANLGKKIEDVHSKFATIKKNNIMQTQVVNRHPEPQIVEVSEDENEEDEIDSEVNNFLKS